MNDNQLPTPKDFAMRDRLNGWTRLLPCRFLEWSSWYNQSVGNRFIGHYRLYTIFKKTYEKIILREIPAAQVYILQYRSTYALKKLTTTVTSFLFSLLNRTLAPASHYSSVNHYLIFERPDILARFLNAAETDFDTSLDQAVQETLSTFFHETETPPKEKPIAIQYNDHRTNNQYNSNVIFQPVLRDGAKGKAKGVFSKKQLLIFLDLLSETNAIERIDFRKPNRFGDIAALLHGLSGKSTTSFVEELNDHRNKPLYQVDTAGERDQLIVILTNLAEAFRAAGFRSIAKLADKKIGELDAIRRF